jgi:hypothetical protein
MRWALPITPTTGFFMPFPSREPFEAPIMHLRLRRINILEALSTAMQVCNGFIPRDWAAFRCGNRPGWLDRGRLLTKE